LPNVKPLASVTIKDGVHERGILVDPAEILDQLTHAEGLPKAALRAASTRRIEMVPVFLREIDSYLALEPADRAKPKPLFFIFHLLGEWREKAAYGPLARLLRCPAHVVDAILGDAITTTTHRVMAAVFDGDPQPLFEIILDPDAEEFVRSRMCEALAMLELRGELDRTIVAQFLHDAFIELRPQAECYVWQGWQSAIAMLGLSELEMLVKDAFDRGFLDPHWLSFEDFRRDLEWAKRHPGEARHIGDDPFTLFGDTVGELSQWYCFSDDDRADRESWVVPIESELVEYQPYRNPLRTVGRNDPCPCGSGKKFKNCCLRH
jgi:Protein of unknown function (DUF1186)/SEC-C motif